MRGRLSSMISRIGLLIAMLPLTGCALVPPRIDPIIICPPPLPPAPSGAIDALDAAGKKDPAVDQWTVALEKHYEVQDACAAGKKGS